MVFAFLQFQTQNFSIVVSWKTARELLSFVPGSEKTAVEFLPLMFLETLFALNYNDFIPSTSKYIA